MSEQLLQARSLLHWVELLFQRGALSYCNWVRFPWHLFAHLWHWLLKLKGRSLDPSRESSRGYFSVVFRPERVLTCIRLQGSSRQAYCTSVDSAVGKSFHLQILSLADISCTFYHLQMLSLAKIFTCKFCHLQILQIADISCKFCNLQIPVANVDLFAWIYHGILLTTIE